MFFPFKPSIDRGFPTFFRMKKAHLKGWSPSNSHPSVKRGEVHTIQKLIFGWCLLFSTDVCSFLWCWMVFLITKRKEETSLEIIQKSSDVTKNHRRTSLEPPWNHSRHLRPAPLLPRHLPQDIFTLRTIMGIFHGVYIYINMYIYIYIYIDRYRYMHMRAYTRGLNIYIYIYENIYENIYIYIITYVCVCAYTCAYTCTYVYPGWYKVMVNQVFCGVIAGF